MENIKYIHREALKNLNLVEEHEIGIADRKKYVAIQILPPQKVD